MKGQDWSLVEANRIRIEILSEMEPGWTETLDETAAYLAGLGKTPFDYVEAWLAFKPSLEALRRHHAPSPLPLDGRRLPRLRPRDPDRVFAAEKASGGRWYGG